MNNIQRICKRCLIRDMQDEDDYFAKLKELIDGIDVCQKSSEKEYEDRLEVCTECDKLTEGLCRLCGCYVEYRAAFKSNDCPQKKW